ncbi:sigma factor [Paenarthrobacter nicotinovorans]|uniref:sigma factor n=1 Tax=Paenarthrobacter nicotinovorans TaxID=29320 RepID=UPI0038003626
MAQPARERDIEDLLRTLAPQVLGVLARKHGQFDACEDAVQEALLEAAMQWPSALPDNPKAWLMAVASRRLVDFYRSENARRAREERVAAMDFQYSAAPETDDTLTLMFLCCHPALSAPSQLALTLRAVGDSRRRKSPQPSSSPKRPWDNASAARNRGSRRPEPRSACRRLPSGRRGSASYFTSFT